VGIKIVRKILNQKLIIKNIVLMSAVGLQLIKESWKNIMKRRQLEMVPIEYVSVALN
jgi:hypothetical protein